MKDETNMRFPNRRETDMREIIIPAIVSFIILVGFFVIMLLIIFVPLPTQESNLIFLLFGTLTGAFTLVVNYWLNLSSNMRNKEIANSLQANQEMDLAKAQSQAEVSKKLADTIQVAANTANMTAKTANTVAKTAQTLAESNTTTTTTTSTNTPTEPPNRA